MATLDADGINGGTLLGFLAAVGSLRLLSEKHPSARLWFDQGDDAARLSVDELPKSESIIEVIVERYFSQERLDELSLLGSAEMPKSVLNEPDVLRFAEQAEEEPNSPKWSFVSAMLCDGLAKKKDDQTAVETVLCAANGASKQKMFQTIRDLHNADLENGAAHRRMPRLVTEAHLQAALTGLWRFADTVPENASWMGNRKPTLRWDEGAERLHALRLHDPTADPEAFSTQFGAYGLASSALPCFPTFPARRGGMTTFTRREDASELIFHWPLWDVPLSLETLVAYHASGEALKWPAEARTRGVYRLMSARRITQDKGKLTFQSSEPVW